MKTTGNEENSEKINENKENPYKITRKLPEIKNKYQPSGAGGTRSPPATPHRLQHVTARSIQNGGQSLERG